MKKDNYSNVEDIIKTNQQNQNHPSYKQNFDYQIEKNEEGKLDIKKVSFRAGEKLF